MALKDLMAQLADMEAEAAINLDEVHPNVRVGAEGRQRHAKDQIGKLRNQYLHEVSGHIFLIAVKGPGSEEFGRLSNEKFDTIAVDYKSLVKRLASALRARRASETYNQTEHWMLLTELQKIKQEYDIAILPAPTFSSVANFYQKPLEEAIEILLRDTYGAQLSTMVLRRDIGMLALTKKFQAAKLPVVIYNFEAPLESGLDSTLLTRPVALINTTKDVNEETVKRDLIKVRDKLTPKKRIRDRRKKKPVEAQPAATVAAETQTSGSKTNE